jgi:Heterokaryon incompatibility protein (HET)
MPKDCIHVPLRNPWDIRVVLLRPGEGEEMIRCDQKVIHVKGAEELGGPSHKSGGALIKTVPYIALSYCWGDPSVTLPILLNGCSFQVTVNLHSFLQHFRQSRTVSVLWIDAICINQGDATERSSMVRRMKSIYEYAKHVLIWLVPLVMIVVLLSRRYTAWGACTLLQKHNWKCKGCLVRKQEV